MNKFSFISGTQKQTFLKKVFNKLNGHIAVNHDGTIEDIKKQQCTKLCKQLNDLNEFVDNSIELTEDQKRNKFFFITTGKSLILPEEKKKTPRQQGLTGVQSYTGTQGLTGVQSYTGIQGLTGVQGPTGIHVNRVYYTNVRTNEFSQNNIGRIGIGEQTPMMSVGNNIIGRRIGIQSVTNPSTNLHVQIATGQNHTKTIVFFITIITFLVVIYNLWQFLF